MHTTLNHPGAVRRVLAFVVAAAALAATHATAAAPPSYQLTGLESMSRANDINNAGQVIGLGAVNNITQGVRWEAGIYTGLLLPANFFARGAPLALNNNGLVAGTTDEVFPTGAVAWVGTTASALPSGSTGPSLAARGVNDAGTMVGTSAKLYGYDVYTERATAWTADGHAHLLNDNFADDSGANAVNRDGLISGWVTNNTGQHAALWSDMQAAPLLLSAQTSRANSNALSINNNGLAVGYDTDFQGYVRATSWFFDLGRFDLGTLPGLNQSLASDINNGGQIVGKSWSFLGTGRAVMWDGTGQMTDLNNYLSDELRDQGWVFYDAMAINDAGSIVVNGLNDRLGLQQAFLLTPVPEPGSLAMFLSGLLMLVGSRRRAARRASQEPAA